MTTLSAEKVITFGATYCPVVKYGVGLSVSTMIVLAAFSPIRVSDFVISREGSKYVPLLIRIVSPLVAFPIAALTVG